MKLELLGSAAGRLVGAPQICKLSSGTSASGPSPFGNASSYDTVVLNVWKKLTALPLKSSGALVWVNWIILSAYAGSLTGGVWLTMVGSGAGNVLPLIRVYGISPGSSRFSVATE